MELNGVITRRTSAQEFDIAGRNVQLECRVQACEDKTEHLLKNAEVRFSGWMTEGGVLHGNVITDDY